MRAHSTSFATQHQICTVRSGYTKDLGSTYRSRSKHSLRAMVIEDNVCDGRNRGHSIRKENVPLLKVVELLGVITMEENQQDIERHAEHLVLVSRPFAHSVDVLTQKESAIMNH